jgi:hypothetical protein
MKPIVKVPLTLGAIAGLLGAVLMIAHFYVIDHPFLIPVFFDFRIFLFGVFIFFTLKELRDLHQQGVLYFWQGLFASFIFVATYAFLSSFILGCFAYADTDFVRTYIELKTAELKAFSPEVVQQIGKEVFERNLEILPSTNGFDLAWLYFWQCFVIGIFISIIMSVILRRLPKP